MPASRFVKFSRTGLLDPVFVDHLWDENDPDQKISKGQGEDESVHTLDRKIIFRSYNLALQASKVLSP